MQLLLFLETNKSPHVLPLLLWWADPRTKGHSYKEHFCSTVLLINPVQVFLHLHNFWSRRTTVLTYWTIAITNCIAEAVHARQSSISRLASGTYATFKICVIWLTSRKDIPPLPRCEMKHWHCWICCHGFSFQHTSPTFKITMFWVFSPQVDRSLKIYCCPLSHSGWTKSCTMILSFQTYSIAKNEKLKTPGCLRTLFFPPL